MMEFDLPARPDSFPVEEAFAPLILGHLSGIVVTKPGADRLLHYAELVQGWRSGHKTLGEIPGGVPLETPNLRFEAHTPVRGPSVQDYELIINMGTSAKIRSRMERLAEMYLSNPAGYCCTGPAQHCYPPYTRGQYDTCVVPFCPGLLP